MVYGSYNNIITDKGDTMEKLNNGNKCNAQWLDDKKLDDWFELAFSKGLFTEDDPYMYMGEDFEKVYFKHGITREYKNLDK